jgi:hypothetical protein
MGIPNTHIQRVKCINETMSFHRNLSQCIWFGPLSHNHLHTHTSDLQHFENPWHTVHTNLHSSFWPSNQGQGATSGKIEWAKRWYATKNTQAIIWSRSHQTQCNPQCPVLNPFQTLHMCICHIRKTNRAIFQDRSNESPFSYTTVSNKMDALPKKPPPISTSSPFGGIFAVHISHVSSIANQNRKIYPNIWNMSPEVANRIRLLLISADVRVF